MSGGIDRKIDGQTDGHDWKIVKTFTTQLIYDLLYRRIKKTAGVETVVSSLPFDWPPWLNNTF